MSEGFTEKSNLSPSKEECTWALFCHLSGIAFGFLGPLIIWLIQKENMSFVDDQGKEALNFQLTVLIASVISAALACVFIGFILLPVVVVANIIFCVMGAIAANKGEAYRYPITFRFI